jgi:integrase
MTSRLFGDDDLTTIFELKGDILGTLDLIHSQLAADFELQTAFVLACSTGLRPRDLFSLCWSDLKEIDGTPAIVKTPKKTERHGTTVRIPLAPCIADRMAELRRRSGSDVKGDELSKEPAAGSRRLFRGLVSLECVDPEKSRAARRRNAAIRAAAERAGFVFPSNRDKPWQIARATCNERLERHCPGIGPFVLGHSAKSVNAKSYRQRWSEAVQAVVSLPQPLGFLN